MFKNKNFLIITLWFCVCLISVVGCAPEEETKTATKNGEKPSQELGAMIPISHLEVGNKVVDSSWEWGHLVGENYSGSGERKPVVWVIAGMDHFDTEEGVSHVTLIAEEVIGLHHFDDSTDRGHHRGNNAWEDSGKTDATAGLRTFLNQEFYGTLPQHFRDAILETNLPNATGTGATYTTSDRVFALSQTELGGGSQDTHIIGERLPYFNTDNPEVLAKRRISTLDGQPQSYWTRSPSAEYSFTARFVHGDNGWFYRHYTDNKEMGVRPALNIHAEVEATEHPNEMGVHEIGW